METSISHNTSIIILCAYLVEWSLQSDGLGEGVGDGDAASLGLVQRVQQLLVL